MLKTVARSMGLDPETILTREALAETYKIYASTIDRENYEIELLGKELKEVLKK